MGNVKITAVSVALLVAIANPATAERGLLNAARLPADVPTEGHDFRYPRVSSESFWYQPLPLDIPLHPDSDGLAAEIARQVHTYYGHASLNLIGYTSPVYTVDADVTRSKVELADCWHNGYRDPKLVEDFSSVPIPTYALPASGSDSEMTIYQPSSDTLWEFWKAKKSDAGWQACWGGRMVGVSGSSGIWPKHYGASATGLPFAPGQIQIEELRRGAINHVMGLAVVFAEAGVYSWPANRTDGWNPKKMPHRVPEGLRFRLDPHVNVDSLKLHPIARTIAYAAQRYGFVVWDVAGAVSLRGENPMRYTNVGLPNPYDQLLAGTPSYKVMDGFPWDKMEFLPMDYGKTP